MSAFSVFARLLMIGITAAVCVRLTRAFGPFAAIGLWALALAAVCGGTALLMHRQTPGRVTAVNYLAGIVLPWGYQIGRGKLLPIVIESWLRWLLLAIAVVVLAASPITLTGLGGKASSPSAPSERSLLITVLLFASWVINGAVVLRLVTVLAMRANSNPLPPGTLLPIVGLAALVIVSVALTMVGRSPAFWRAALLLSGAPIVLVGGGYGLFLLVMMTVGRNARWN